MTLDEKFKGLETNNAPGQEVRQNLGDLNTIMLGKKLDGNESCGCPASFLSS